MRRLRTAALTVAALLVVVLVASAIVGGVLTLTDPPSEFVQTQRLKSDADAIVAQWDNNLPPGSSGELRVKVPEGSSLSETDSAGVDYRLDLADSDNLIELSVVDDVCRNCSRSLTIELAGTPAQDAELIFIMRTATSFDHFDDAVEFNVRYP